MLAECRVADDAAMRMSVALLAFSFVSACQSAPGVVPDDALASIWDPATRTPATLLIEGAHVVGWSTRCEASDVPKRARFALEAIVGDDGDGVWNRVVHREAVSYELLGDIDTGTFVARVDADGAVIERSHSIPAADMPPSVPRPAVDSVWFVQGSGPDRYVMFTPKTNPHGALRLTEYLADGTVFRERILSQTAVDASR